MMDDTTAHATAPASAAPVGPDVGAPRWLLDLGLLAMAALVLVPIMLGLAESIGPPLALAVHVLLSRYDGRYPRLRTLTWVLMICGFALSTLVGFFSYMLPWGQMTFWLAARLPAALDWLDLWNQSDRASAVLGAVRLLAPAVPLALVILDIAAMHGPRLRARRPSLILLVGLPILVLVPVIGDIAHLVAPVAPGALRPNAATPLTISLSFAPFYAILRMPPDKMVGVVLMFGAMLLPAVWPWANARRFHAPRARRAFIVGVIALAASWLALAMLGLAPLSSWNRIAVLLLALYDAAFFLVLPSVLARLVPKLGDRQADVFA